MRVPVLSGLFSSRNPMLRTATRYGVALGVINSVFSVLNLFVPLLDQIDVFVSVIAGIALLTLVGIEIGRRKGAATPAMLAGLWAGAISWAVNAVVVLFLTLVFTDQYLGQLIIVARSQHQPLNDLTSGAVIAGNVILLVLDLCVALAFGSFLGGLGGIIGKRQAQRASVKATEQPEVAGASQAGAS